MANLIIRYNLRITPNELTRWRAAAVAADIALSAWIRKCCNGSGYSMAFSGISKKAVDALRDNIKFRKKV